MALSQVHFLSQALSRITTFHIYLPNDVSCEFTDNNPNYDRDTKTLYLLHGFSGNSTDWITGSNAMEVSRQYNVAIVMPSGENSFYLNRKGTGSAYETYVAEELPDYIKRTYNLSDDKNDVSIGGLSMGGFGAIRLGVKFGEKYGAAFGLSSAFIINDIANLSPDTMEEFSSAIADYDFYANVFGDLSKVKNSDVNPEYIIKRRLEEGRRLPRIFMACGTEDSLIENNRKFWCFLKENGVPATYYESPGIHDWKFWNEYLEKAVLWTIS